MVFTGVEVCGVSGSRRKLGNIQRLVGQSEGETNAAILKTHVASSNRGVGLSAPLHSLCTTQNVSTTKEVSCLGGRALSSPHPPLSNYEDVHDHDLYF